MLSDPFGEPLHPKRLGKEIRGLVRDSPFTPKLSAHGFRDTYATILLAVYGIADRKVAKVLGYSNPRVTHDRYNRWTPSYDDKYDWTGESSGRRANVSFCSHDREDGS